MSEEAFQSGDPFDETAQRWIVKKFVILHTTRKITVRIGNFVHEKNPDGSNRAFHGMPLGHNEPDERFKDLPELEKKYRHEVKVSKRQWEKVESDLYPLVMKLLKEDRIEGKFDLPLQDLVNFKELEGRLAKLEERVDALDFSPSPARGSGDGRNED